MFRIESFLSARLFMSPKLVEGRIYFISNISGRLSLYVMDEKGSVPEALLPSHIAMQNPQLVDGIPFIVFPKIGKILIALDNDGDEMYQPMLIPIDGGFPEPAFPEKFQNSRIHIFNYDVDTFDIYFSVESTLEEIVSGYRGNLKTGDLHLLGSSQFGRLPVCFSQDHKKVILFESYTLGDTVLMLWDENKGKETPVIFGKLLEDRKEDESVPVNGINAVEYNVPDGLIINCAVFEDSYSLAYLDLNHPGEVKSIALKGIQHKGVGELVNVTHLVKDRYMVSFNIDGVSWVYEAIFIKDTLTMDILHVLVGMGKISNGVVESIYYDKGSDKFVLSHSTATSPAQISLIEGDDRGIVSPVTHDKVLGIDARLLAPGEDASFTSFDGLRVSARLYIPSKELGYLGPRPVVYYIHGGPQSQERPDFAWFSMPLIQFLTLNGFAVFVPNVRGSTGYGLTYSKQVDRDWGGKDRLDHVEAVKILTKDNRLDLTRAGVVGRSYGGYMTLTQASRHPELWKAAVDMFGPFDLISFSDRIPETWKPFLRQELGDPTIPEELAMLKERSPKTHIDSVACPMLVIQGKNDPRVVEPESRDLVEYLRKKGKNIEYLMFENEGHDVLKYENRVRCYTEITEFFKKYLQP